jgi:hypothetical protein
MRRVLVAAMAAVVMLAGANVAWADHTHVLILPNGKCAILAAEGNEKYQILPSVFSATTHGRRPRRSALNRRHPLHVLVHLGVPGRGRGYCGDGLGPGSVRRDR